MVPDANIYLKSDQYRHLARRYAEVNDRVVLLSCRKEEHRKDMTEDSFYPIGVTGFVKEVNEEGYVEIRTTGRVNLDIVGINPDHTIELTVSRCEEIEDLDEGVEQAHFEQLKADLKESWQGFEWGEQAMGYLNQFHSISEVAVAMSIWFKMSAEEKYAILAQDSHKKRLQMLEEAVYEFMEVSKVTTKAASAQQEDYQKIYKESAIKKQMELLQRELDEMHPEKVSDIRKFEIKIEEAGMNETAKGEALKVLNRLKQESNGGTEAGMLYDYLDFVTELSWKKEQAQDIDLSEAEAVLEEDHFGLKKVKQRIIQQIAVMNLKKQQSGSILLFVGAPGTGKTSIGQSIAKALHRKYVRVSLGGVRDEADIRGHRRTYIGAMPGRIMDGIKKSGVSNPVMVLDEVDKLGISYNGDPASALLEVLDEGEARRHKLLGEREIGALPHRRVERACIDADANGTARGPRCVDHRIHTFHRAYVSRIDAQGGSSALGGTDGQHVVEVDVCDDRHGRGGAYLGKRTERRLVRHGHADDLAACVGKPANLGKRRCDVRCGGVAHGLHAHGGSPADIDASNGDATRQVARGLALVRLGKGAHAGLLTWTLTYRPGCARCRCAGQSRR